MPPLLQCKARRQIWQKMKRHNLKIFRQSRPELAHKSSRPHSKVGQIRPKSARLLKTKFLEIKYSGADKLKIFPWHFQILWRTQAILRVPVQPEGEDRLLDNSLKNQSEPWRSCDDYNSGGYLRRVRTGQENLFLDILAKRRLLVKLSFGTLCVHEMSKSRIKK